MTQLLVVAPTATADWMAALLFSSHAAIPPPVLRSRMSLMPLPLRSWVEALCP
jgi:hypothetical protein